MQGYPHFPSNLVSGNGQLYAKLNVCDLIAPLVLNYVKVWDTQI